MAVQTLNRDAAERANERPADRPINQTKALPPAKRTKANTTKAPNEWNNANNSNKGATSNCDNGMQSKIEPEMPCTHRPHQPTAGACDDMAGHKRSKHSAVASITGNVVIKTHLNAVRDGCLCSPRTHTHEHTGIQSRRYHGMQPKDTRGRGANKMFEHFLTAIVVVGCRTRHLARLLNMV